GRKVSAADLAQALRASAEPFAGASAIDEGAGVPQLEAAYRWLLGGHQGSEYIVRSRDGTPGAFRRDGLAGPGDTLQAFRVRHVAGLRAAQFLLRSSVAWLSVPGSLEAGPRETEIRVVYSPAALTAPGAHVGVVTAWNARHPRGPAVHAGEHDCRPVRPGGKATVRRAPGDRPGARPALLSAGGAAGGDPRRDRNAAGLGRAARHGTAVRAERAAVPRAGRGAARPLRPRHGTI